MSFWITLATGVAVLALIAAAAVWAASAFWVHIVSNRWNAMCAEEEPPKKP